MEFFPSSKFDPSEADSVISLAVILPPLGVFLERGCGSTIDHSRQSHTTQR